MYDILSFPTAGLQAIKVFILKLFAARLTLLILLTINFFVFCYLYITAMRAVSFLD